jgi:hypothetical protein
MAKDAGLSNADYVTSIFVALLGRKPDAGGLAHFVESLDSGARDRYQVITTIASSDEGRQRGARVVDADSSSDRREASAGAGHPGAA